MATVTNQYLDMMTGWLLTFSSFVFVPISFVMFILPFVSKKSSLKRVLPSNDFTFIYLCMYLFIYLFIYLLIYLFIPKY